VLSSPPKVVYRALAACSQRPGGFAKAGLPQMFMRATKFQLRTAFSAALLPRFRKTARCVAGILLLHIVPTEQMVSIVRTLIECIDYYSAKKLFPTFVWSKTNKPTPITIITKHMIIAPIKLFFIVIVFIFYEI
jgi:hypothetical protein